MAVARRGKPPVRRSAAPAKPARRAAVPQAKRRDVTEYAVKVPTPYHKIFAKWIVEEVGYNPDEARSLRAAFLKGVSIATAARPAFNSSDYIEEWRERTGETKRGPKPKEEEAAPAGSLARRRKPAPEPEPEDDEDEFDDESDELDDDSDEDEDDEFDEDDSDDDSDEDESDDDEFDDEEEEAPAPKKRPVPQRGAAKSAGRSAPARKAVPAKKAGRPTVNTTARKSAKSDDDDFLF